MAVNIRPIRKPRLAQRRRARRMHAGLCVRLPDVSVIYLLLSCLSQSQIHIPTQIFCNSENLVQNEPLIDCISIFYKYINAGQLYAGTLAIMVRVPSIVAISLYTFVSRFLILRLYVYQFLFQFRKQRIGIVVRAPVTSTDDVSSISHPGSLSCCSLLSGN